MRSGQKVVSHGTKPMAKQGAKASRQTRFSLPGGPKRGVKAKEYARHPTRGQCLKPSNTPPACGVRATAHAHARAAGTDRVQHPTTVFRGKTKRPAPVAPPCGPRDCRPRKRQVLFPRSTLPSCVPTDSCHSFPALPSPAPFEFLGSQFLEPGGLGRILYIMGCYRIAVFFVHYFKSEPGQE